MTPSFQPELAVLRARDLRAEAAAARRDPARRDPARRDPARRGAARHDPAHRGLTRRGHVLATARHAAGFWLIEAGLHLLAGTGGGGDRPGQRTTA
jgi:hypothetical protein